MKRQIAALLCAWLLIVSGLALSPPPARAATAPVFDKFIATNGTNLTTYSANWTVNAGAASIQSNAVTWNNATAGVAFRNDVTWAANQTACMTVTATDISGNSQIGPAVRVQSAANSGYVLQNSANGTGTTTNNLFEISKVAAGAFTVLLRFDNIGAGAGSSPVGVLTGDVICISAVGTTITAWKNGLALGSVTDGSFATGNAGIYGAGTGQSSQATNWIGDANPGASLATTAAVSTGTSFPTFSTVNVGSISQVGQVVQLSLQPQSAAYGAVVGGQISIVVTSSIPPVGATYGLQFSSDGGVTWQPVAGISNAINPLTPGQSGPVYSVIYGLSGLKAGLFQFGPTSALTIPTPLVVFACEC